MKILIISTNSDLAGVPIYVSILGRGLHANGCQVLFMFGSQGPVMDALTAEGFTSYLMTGLESRLTPLADILILIRILKCLRSCAPDLVHLNSSKSALLGRLACGLLGIPCVYTVHGWAFGKGRPFLQSAISYLLELSFSPLVSSYIFVAQQDLKIATRLLFLPRRKLFHVFNGIPESNECSSLPVFRYDVLMLARIHPQKDHETLLKALAKSPFSLALAGTGTDSVQFIDYCRGILGDACSNVDFLGPRSDVELLIASSKVIALTSVYESLPISLIEALRAGRPIVASDVGDVSSIVLHGVNGFVCPVGDSSSISSSIHAILSDNGLAASMGSASRLRYEEMFSSAAMVQSVQAVYADSLP